MFAWFRRVFGRHVAPTRIVKQIECSCGSTNNLHARSCILVFEWLAGFAFEAGVPDWPLPPGVIDLSNTRFER